MYKEQTDPLKAFFEEMDAEFTARSGIQTKPVPYDKHYKRRMNRFARYVGLKKIPYPKADNIFKRFISKLKII